MGGSSTARGRSLAISKVMTILVYFHPAHYCYFMAYYFGYMSKYLRSEFPGRVSCRRLPGDLSPAAQLDKAEESLICGEQIECARPDHDGI